MTKLKHRAKILKADGTEEEFDEGKLRASLAKSGATEPEVEEVVSHIVTELHDGMTTAEIYRHAFSLLEHSDRPVARRYSLRRAILDLGPSGFPFEDFLAEMFKAKGFECLTRQTVLGACVPHEVDVVAYDAKELIMVEAKFHNELGAKTDLKVALYVKARFDDLRENTYDYGGTNRKVTGCWLVTNTKFSSTAIEYGRCNDLTLIGWNYPEKGNLQDMIESLTLHPVTCLATLSSGEKKALLEARVVLCSDIKRRPEVLQEILGNNYDSTNVLAEINDL